MPPGRVLMLESVGRRFTVRVNDWFEDPLESVAVTVITELMVPAPLTGLPIVTVSDPLVPLREGARFAFGMMAVLAEEALIVTGPVPPVTEKLTTGAVLTSPVRSAIALTVGAAVRGPASSPPSRRLVKIPGRRRGLNLPGAEAEG